MVRYISVATSSPRGGGKLHLNPEGATFLISKRPGNGGLALMSTGQVISVGDDISTLLGKLKYTGLGKHLITLQTAGGEGDLGSCDLVVDPRMTPFTVRTSRQTVLVTAPNGQEIYVAQSWPEVQALMEGVCVFESGDPPPLRGWRELGD
jgi:hypothetical protein